MHPQTVWRDSAPASLLKTLHQTHVHSGFAIAVVSLLALLAFSFNSFFVTEVDIGNDTLTFTVAQKRLHAAGPSHSLATLRGVDVMKYTKDLMRNQQSDAEIEGIVAAIADNLHPTHISISIPMDASADYPGAAPSPRTAEAFTQKWADAIHAQGIGIIWRGTWSGIEGIYDFPKRDGTDRLPAGSAATAVTDGNSTWLGKTFNYIAAHPGFFQANDIWAPMPERTEGIFQDSSSFLPHDGAGIQANYANFFNDMKLVSDSAFNAIGVYPQTGWTANNYTEVASGWLPNSIFATAGITAIDHYGSSHTVAEMEADIRAIYAQKGKQVFLQEWGDYWNSGMELSARLVYLLDMYSMLQDLSDEGILAGFNYWGGWVNDMEGILANNGGTYGINERGAALASLFGRYTEEELSQSPTPTPAPSPTPPPAGPSTGGGGGSKSTPGRATQPASGQAASAAGNDIAPPPTLPYRTGTLVNDSGTIYLIMGRSRIPFTNFDAFVTLGFAKWPIATGSTAGYQTPSQYKLENGSQQHPWGTWIILGGTVYYSDPSGLLGVPSLEILLNNGGRLGQLVMGNAADKAAIQPSNLGMNDPRVIK